MATPTATAHLPSSLPPLVPAAAARREDDAGTPRAGRRDDEAETAPRWATPQPLPDGADPLPGDDMPDDVDDVDNNDAGVVVPLDAPPLGAGPAAGVAPLPAGQLYTWGRAASGQLGQRRFLHPPGSQCCALPFPVRGALCSRVCHVACGGLDEGFTVCVTASGAVVTFGKDAFGRLGHGWPPPPPSSKSSSCGTARVVDTLRSRGVRAVRVAAGCEHAACLGSDGHVWCWGRNIGGCLGRGTVGSASSSASSSSSSSASSSAPRGDNTLPAPVLDLGHGRSSWIQTHYGRKAAYNGGSGRSDASGLRGGGAGHHVTSCTSQPPHAATAAAAAAERQWLAHVVDIDCEYHYSGALLSDGRLVLWGSNTHGQLGCGDLVDRPLPSQARGLRDSVESFSLGTRYAACINRHGAVFAWGDGSHGNLGLGDRTGRLVPTRVAGAGLDLQRAVTVRCSRGQGWHRGGSGRVLRPATEAEADKRQPQQQQRRGRRRRRRRRRSAHKAPPGGTTENVKARGEEQRSLSPPAALSPLSRRLTNRERTVEAQEPFSFPFEDYFGGAVDEDADDHLLEGRIGGGARGAHWDGSTGREAAQLLAQARRRSPLAHAGAPAVAVRRDRRATGSKHERKTQLKKPTKNKTPSDVTHKSRRRSKARNEVACGGDEGAHTLCICADGALYTWGTASHGVLANLAQKTSAVGTAHFDELLPYRVGGRLHVDSAVLGRHHKRNDGGGVGGNAAPAARRLSHTAVTGELSWSAWDVAKAVEPPLSPFAVWPDYASCGPFTGCASGHDHCLALNGNGELWAWGNGADGRCGVERFLNGAGERRNGKTGAQKPPRADKGACFLMGPHRVGVARPAYWPGGESLMAVETTRVVMVCAGRNHSACIVVAEGEGEADTDAKEANSEEPLPKTVRGPWAPVGNQTARPCFFPHCPPVKSDWSP